MELKISIEMQILRMEADDKRAREWELTLLFLFLFFFSEIIPGVVFVGIIIAVGMAIRACALSVVHHNLHFLRCIISALLINQILEISNRDDMKNWGLIRERTSFFFFSESWFFLLFLSFFCFFSPLSFLDNFFFFFSCSLSFFSASSSRGRFLVSLELMMCSGSY